MFNIVLSVVGALLLTFGLAMVIAALYIVFGALGIVVARVLETIERRL